MNTKLFVGNLATETTEDDVRTMFAAHGSVDEIKFIMDRVTGRPRGFGFVTLDNEAGVDSAILALNGKEWKGRRLTVNVARENGGPRS